MKKLAGLILNYFKYEVNAEKIIKFDIVSFVVGHSIENVDLFLELTFEIIK